MALPNGLLALGRPSFSLRGSLRRTRICEVRVYACISVNRQGAQASPEKSLAME